MPTDAEIARFLTERVLGWEVRDRWPGEISQWAVHPDPAVGMKRVPDFLTWEGFGLLWEALVIPGEQDVELTGWGAPSGNKATARIVGKRFGRERDPDPCRALMLAAARAYGMEGV